MPAGAKVNLRINQVCGQETWEIICWTCFPHQYNGGRRRIPVISYVTKDLNDLIAYMVKGQNPANTYVIWDVQGGDLLLCPQCGWICQGYITDRCFQCKSQIIWNCAQQGLPPPELLTTPPIATVSPAVAAADPTG